MAFVFSDHSTALESLKSLLTLSSSSISVSSGKNDLAFNSIGIDRLLSGLCFLSGGLSALGLLLSLVLGWENAIDLGLN